MMECQKAMKLVKFRGIKTLVIRMAMVLRIDQARIMPLRVNLPRLVMNQGQLMACNQ